MLCPHSTLPSPFVSDGRTARSARHLARRSPARNVLLCAVELEQLEAGSEAHVFFLEAPDPLHRGTMDALASCAASSGATVSSVLVEQSVYHLLLQWQ